MAESLFTTIENGKMEVTHNGEEAYFELPEWMKEAGEVLENEEGLLEWAKKHKILLATFHAALAKWKIDFCAAVRPADIKGEKKGEKIKVSLLKDFDNAWERGLAFKAKPATRPGTGGKTPEERMKKAQNLLAGLTPEQIQEVLRKAQA